MLSALISNSNVEKILLFLFVNEKAHASLIKNLLGISLAPIQKALEKLESGNVITSCWESNRKVYTPNPNYPLKQELEALIKKTYLLLPKEEKSKYCFIHKPRLSFDEEIKKEKFRRRELSQFFKRLSKVKHLNFEARHKSGLKMEEKVGQAKVQIASDHPNELIFMEKGVWSDGPQPGSTFYNSFRWTLNLDKALITLEHLRYGEQNPVFLFHLTSNVPQTLDPVDAHICKEDTYLGSIKWSAQKIEFQWRVIGPKKNNSLYYTYS